MSTSPLSDLGTIRVTWTPPSTTHGLDVIEYLVQYKDKDVETYREQRLKTPTIVGGIISLQTTTEIYIIARMLGCSENNSIGKHVYVIIPKGIEYCDCMYGLFM